MHFLVLIVSTPFLFSCGPKQPEVRPSENSNPSLFQNNKLDLEKPLARPLRKKAKQLVVDLDRNHLSLGEADRKRLLSLGNEIPIRRIGSQIPRLTEEERSPWRREENNTPSMPEAAEPPAEGSSDSTEAPSLDQLIAENYSPPSGRQGITLIDIGENLDKSQGASESSDSDEASSQDETIEGSVLTDNTAPDAGETAGNTRETSQGSEADNSTLSEENAMPVSVENTAAVQTNLVGGVSIDSKSLPVSLPHRGSPGGLIADSLNVFQCASEENHFTLHLLNYRVPKLGTHPICEILYVEEDTVTIKAYAHYQRVFCDQYITRYTSEQGNDCVSVVKLNPHITASAH